jgi:predicted SprT family Zn-dependent metalloprotease
MNLSKHLAKLAQLDATIGAFKPIWPDDKVRAIIKKVCVANGHPEFVDKIKFEWNKNMTRTMGYAWYYKNLIHLSTLIFARASDAEREQTIAHEAAHLIAFTFHQEKGHGAYFYNALIVAGYKPERCHRVDISGLKAARANTAIGRNPAQ